MTLKIFSIFFYLLPLAIVSGPFLSDLFLCLIGIYFLIVSIHKKLWFYYRNYFVYIFIFFYFYIILRSLLSSDSLFSFESSLFYFRYLFFSLGVAYLIDNNSKLIKYFSISLLFTILIVSVDAYYQSFTGYNLIGIQRISPYNYLSGIFGDENILGSFLARMMPLLFALISLLKIKRYFFFLAMIVLVLMDVLVFLSGERTAFFLVLLGSILIILCIKNFKLERLIALFFSSLIILLIIFTSPNVKDRMIDQTLNSIGLTSHSEMIYLFSSGHQSLFSSAGKMFLDNPLFGKGPKMFRKLCNDKKFRVTFPEQHCSTHPHNTYIQLLAEVGIVGMFPVLLIFIFICYQLLKHTFFLYLRYQTSLLKDYQVCIFIYIIISLWPFIPTGNFFNNWLSVIYYLPIGFLLTNKKL